MLKSLRLSLFKRIFYRDLLACFAVDLEGWNNCFTFFFRLLTVDFLTRQFYVQLVCISGTEISIILKH